MKIGIIGLPKSGKTSIFNALTGQDASTSGFNAKKAEPNVASVDVKDKRVDVLVQMYRPKKITCARFDVMDFVGMERKEGQVFSPSELSLIKASDTLCIVLRNFEDDIIDGMCGKSNPISELNEVFSELVLTDLIIVENRLERIRHGFKRGVKTSTLVKEEDILCRISKALESGRPVSSVDTSIEEKKILSVFQFLTSKPIMVILNSGEDTFGNNADVLSKIGKNFRAIEFAGKFEIELSSLGEEDAAMFMEEMGINGSALNRLAMLAYDVLGYISFFTVGPDEVRAWTIKKGDIALDAAGAIHSDIARGFIRAECFSYDDLIGLGSEKAIKKNGLFRLEGKNYRVKDGDILGIRFSV